MNYILFMADEMRAESVSCYGHPLVQMPNYDRIAKEGVKFEQCHVQHTVCSPSRCSAMTGWYPHVSGHRTLWHLLRPHEPSLFKYLKEAGFHIEWYGKNDLYAKESFTQCVDHYDHKEGGHAGPNPYDKNDPRYYSFRYEPFPGTPEETGDMRNVQGGIDFLRSRQKDDKPFLLYLPLSLPHAPYAAPQPYHDMYDPQDIPALRPAELSRKPDFFKLIQQYRRVDELPDGFLEKIQAIYLGMNSYMDWILGQLLKVLDETGLSDDTTLIVSSDHGDWAGDFGLVEKWPSGLDDTLTRVPLLIRAPGNTAGHVVEEPVALFDIMATVLDMEGIKAGHSHFAMSLVSQLKGQPGQPDRAVFAEGGYDLHETHCFEGRWSDYDIPRDTAHIYWPKGLQQQEHPESVCRAAMMRTMDYKLIRRTAGVSELYDLKKDPRELNNVYDQPAYAPIRTDMETRMLAWYMHTADVVPQNEDPRGLPPAQPVTGI